MKEFSIFFRKSGSFHPFEEVTISNMLLEAMVETQIAGKRTIPISDSFKEKLLKIIEDQDLLKLTKICDPPSKTDQIVFNLEIKTDQGENNLKWWDHGDCKEPEGITKIRKELENLIKS